jgi:selenocysteine lyase/cysteine desulfurase
MNKDLNKGELFSEELLKQIKDKFYNVDSEPQKCERLFFDNAGGSFRLKSTLEVFQEIDSLPDCPERVHDTALYLQKIQKIGTDDIRTILNAKDGSIVTSLTASQIMFQIVGTIAENIPGTNMVTTVLEHPSAFDSMKYYADKTNKELRVVKTNPVSGSVDVEEVIKLIDKDTCVLSVMYASNISGAILDIENIIKEARKVKPDLYIIVDAVQHAPHGVIDLEKTPVDAMNFAPYKFFGVRGSGIAYVSDRVASMPHHRLLAKQPNEWELGSPAPAQFAVITEIVNYVCWIGSHYIENQNRRELFVEGMNRIKLHERALMYRMLNGTDEMPGLRSMEGVSVFLDYEDLTTRDLIMAIGIDNLEYRQAVREYEKLGVIVYERVATSLYSKRMLDSFGLEGAIRISPLHCHTPEDIDKFLRITEKLASSVIE